jgi:hypothetical protein
MSRRIPDIIQNTTRSTSSKLPPSLDDAPNVLDWLRFRFGYRFNTTSPYQILHLLHPVLRYAHDYSLRAVFWLSASTRPIPAMLLLHLFLYLFHNLTISRQKS